MSLPPPPDPLPPAQFSGGVRSSWMDRRGPRSLFGHLRFDDAQLRIGNGALEVTASRENTEAVRVRRFLWSARVRVVYRSGFQPRTFFAASNPDAVVRELRARGWPVVEASRLRGRG